MVKNSKKSDVKKEKKLFECNSIFNLDEYRKMFINFPINMWFDTIYGLGIILIVIIVLCIFTKITFIDSIFLFLFVFICRLIINKIRIKKLAVRYFKKLYNNNLNFVAKSKTVFYKNYLVRISDNSKQEVKYDEIKVIKETKDDIFIGTSKGLLGFQKSNCSLELIDFIRNINNDKNILKIGKDIYDKSNYKQSDVVKKILNILFILCICSVFLGLIFWWIFTVDVNPYFEIEHCFYILLALPFPILSLVFGIYFSRYGYDTKKNIIWGIVMSIPLLLGFIIPFSMRELYVDFNLVKEYDSIIDVGLPTSGIYKKIEWDEPKGLISSYIEFDNKNEYEKFYSDIKKSDNWVSGYDGDKMSNFSIKMNNQMTCYSKKCFYSLYNEDDCIYNELPLEEGSYNITFMMYDPDICTLQIHEMNYDVKK